MNKDFTKIVVISDRSGSMACMQVEAENGINAFIEEQKNAPGRASITLVDFDTQYRLIYNGDIRDCPKYVLEPRGGTALNDAIGKTANEVGIELSRMAECDRPGLVLVLIVTDGQENSSHEFRQEQIKEIIERQQGVYNWQFTFIGTNQDALTTARSYGMNINAAAQYCSARPDLAYKGASMKFMRMRDQSVCGQNVCNDNSLEEREMMEGKSADVQAVSKNK